MSKNINKIGFGYIFREESMSRHSHSIMCSLMYKIDEKIKNDKKKGKGELEDLYDKDIELFNIKTGKSRGSKARLREYDSFDKIYIMEDDLDYLKSEIDRDDIDSKCIVISVSSLEKLVDDFKFSVIDNIDIADILIMRLMYDINFNFKNTDIVKKYSYRSPEELLKDGDSAIQEVLIDDFSDFIINEVLDGEVYSYQYRDLFDTKKEVYENALKSVKANIHANNITRDHYKDLLRRVENNEKRLEDNYNTLKSIIDLKYS